VEEEKMRLQLLPHPVLEFLAQNGAGYEVFNSPRTSDECFG
jgi:hypothetical protein